MVLRRRVGGSTRIPLAGREINVDVYTLLRPAHCVVLFDVHEERKTSQIPRENRGSASIGSIPPARLRFECDQL